MCTLFRLVRLEWKQNCMKKYLRISIIILIVILLITWITNQNEILDGILHPMWLTDLCFMVYTGVLFAIFVIDGCKGSVGERTFTYPNRRRDLLVAKVISVWFAVLIIWILGKLLIYASFIGQTGYGDIQIGAEKFLAVNIVLDTVSLLNICLIPLLAGMFMDSSKAGIACTVFWAALIRKVSIVVSPVIHFYVCAVSVGIAAVLLIILVKLIEKRDI